MPFAAQAARTIWSATRTYPACMDAGECDAVRNGEPRERRRGFPKPGHRLVELALGRGVHGSGGRPVLSWSVTGKRSAGC